EVDERLDANLLPALEAIAEIAEGRPDDEAPGGFAPDFESRLESEFADARSGICFEALAADGSVVAPAPSLREPTRAPPPPFEGERTRYDLELPGGGRGRALAVRADDRTVLLATETATMERRLASLRNLLLAVGAATWLSALLVGAVALKRGLAPF